MTTLLRSFPLAVAAAALLTATVLAQAPADDRARQVADLEKQLADLKTKLASLKTSANGTTSPAPRPLALADALAWKRLGSPVLSRDGRWVAYRVGPGEGDGEVIVRQTQGDKEYKLPGGDGSFGVLTFSDDNQWLAFSAAPTRRGPQTPPTPGASPRPAPTTKAVLVKLATGEKTEYESVRRFSFSGEAAAAFAVHRAAAATTVPTPPVPGAAPTPPERATGSDLLLRDLATGSELTLGNVAEFAFDKKGRWLALAIDAQGQAGNGVQLRDMKTAALHQLDADKAAYQGLTWTEKGDGLTVLKAVEDKASKGKVGVALGFTNFGGATPTRVVYDPRQDKAFPAGMTIGTGRNVTFADDLGALFFGIAELKKADAPTTATKPAATGGPKPDATTATAKTGTPKEKPDLVVWHWRDDRPQPMQQVQAGMDRSFNYLACYRIAEKKFLRLADDSLRQVTPAAKQRWAVGIDVREYQRMGNLDGKRFQDVYVVDLQTGQKRLALKKNRWYMGTSPAGTHLLFYDDGHFHTHDMATGKSVKISEGTAASFVDTEDDHNVDRPPTRPVGWSADGAFVLLSDNWDIWKVPAVGGTAINLTGNGRKDGIRYRGVLSLDPEAKGIDLAAPVLFSTYGEWTKKSGVSRLEPGKTDLVRLCWEDADVGGLMKARDAEVYLHSRQTWTQHPEFYVTDATLVGGRKVSDVGSQQAKFAWSAGAQLLDYASAKGDRLQAALYLPANYEKGKSYPTIVYIYERLSQGLNRFAAPAVGGGGFNPAIYTSNGYAVLTPDIKYTVNDPGMSAVWCVLPALDAAVRTGVVDKGRVGLHGHSWGGYQTSFLITQTEAFKAAVAGAPLTNLVSMYSAMYWNTGSANQPIFESSQGRFTSGYWDNWDAYIRNSPVYHAKRVTTPLLLLHNDKDGAVDFTQGIEYFNTLRRLEKPVVMLQYKGENHGLAKAANQRDYAVRMREFFDHHLMGKEAPAWLKEGVPHLKIDEHLEARDKSH